ncbi:unnamed protein product [Diabrotica balteata]|uniref:BESS domain-containing protein n=1 Tax=Diabrotica balteata TaxID=107213 RepID=A0A9N9SWZ7_DIABA|nr:unnamed protein product [Diabrotica balteata]
MAFVTPFFMERKIQDSLDIMISDDKISDNADENQVNEFTASENPTTDVEADITPAEVSHANNTIISNETSSESQQINYKKKQKAVKRKACRSEPSTSAILMAKLLDDQNKLEPPRKHDELDRFFLNISDTVKKFSPYVQALAKIRYFL